MSVRRYTSLGRLLEDTEPDVEAFFVHFNDHQNSMQAAKLIRGGMSKIIKEQERLLTYVYKYFPARVLLSDGWMEDCKEILAIDSTRNPLPEPK